MAYPQQGEHVLTGRTWLLAGTAAALGVVIVAITHEREPPRRTLEATASSAQPAGTAATLTTPIRDSDRASSAGSSDPRAALGTAALGTVEDSNEGDGAFRTDAAGELVVDEQTRLNLEALIARNGSRALDAEVREQTEHLSPGASREAEELFQKFLQYQEAQRQTYPPGDAPLTADDAVRELEGLHALREAHFGPELAQRLYGSEEAIAREMIEVMRIENDQSLTAEEKLERAQALRARLPGVAAIERSNRETAATREREQQK